MTLSALAEVRAVAAGITDVPGAVAAALSVVQELGLPAESAVVVHASNRLAVRLMPAEVLARVAPDGHDAAQFEVDLATRLAQTKSPVAPIDPRVVPRVVRRDGLAITLWTWFDTQASANLDPAAYAGALERLHRGLRGLDVPTPHFLDRVREAEAIVANHAPTPELTEADRALLQRTLATTTAAIAERGASEQPLHGEPHPGNVLNTKVGPLFIDLETCCRGPIEFDLAHVPTAVSDAYPNADQELVGICRLLVLAMVAAWRFEPGDLFPNGMTAAHELLGALRAGPPYPTLGQISGLE